DTRLTLSRFHPSERARRGKACRGLQRRSARGGASADLVPGEGLAALQVAGGGASEHVGQVLRRQAVAGTDGADVGRAERLALLHVGDDVERAAVLAAGGLRRDLLVVDVAERGPGV